MDVIPLLPINYRSMHAAASADVDDNNDEIMLFCFSLQLTLSSPPPSTTPMHIKSVSYVTDVIRYP